MRARLAVVGALVVATRADAAPTADVVVLWAAEPSAATAAAVGDAARRADAALIDVSPAATAAPDAAPLVIRGIDAYGALEFDAALTAFDAAVDQVDRTGGAGLDKVSLGDLFLYRGLVHAQRGDDGRAWDDFLSAATIDPIRVLDPARFPPRAVEQHTRALAAVAARNRGTVALAPAGCKIEIDGAAVAGRTVELNYGRHWLRAACDGHEPAGRRIDLDRAELAIEVAGPAVGPPSDDEIAIQGRSANARAVVVVAIRRRVAVIRRLGIDGREQDRATVTVAGDRDAAAVADAVTRMLAPRPEVARRPWYRSRWVWAAAGAAVATAILLPFALASGGGPPGVVVRPENVPAW